MFQRDQVSCKCRSSVVKVSIKCRSSVVQVSAKYMHTQVHICTHMCTYMHGCAQVCMHKCTQVCTCGHRCVCAHTRTHVHRCTQVYTGVQKCACTSVDQVSPKCRSSVVVGTKPVVISALQWPADLIWKKYTARDGVCVDSSECFCIWICTSVVNARSHFSSSAVNRW